MNFTLSAPAHLKFQTSPSGEAKIFVLKHHLGFSAYGFMTFRARRARAPGRQSVGERALTLTAGVADLILCLGELAPEGRQAESETLRAALGDPRRVLLRFSVGRVLSNAHHFPGVATESLAWRRGLCQLGGNRFDAMVPSPVYLRYTVSSIMHLVTMSGDTH